MRSTKSFDSQRTVQSLSVGAAVADAIASLSLAALPVRAQDAPVAGDTGLQEITVTARRREESLLDAPIAVSSFSAARLEAVGAEALAYLSQETSNVTLENSRATNSTLTAFIMWHRPAGSGRGLRAGRRHLPLPR